MTRSGTTDASTRSSIVITSATGTVFSSSRTIRRTSPATARWTPRRLQGELIREHARLLEPLR